MGWALTAAETTRVRPSCEMALVCVGHPRFVGVSGLDGSGIRLFSFVSNSIFFRLVSGEVGMDRYGMGARRVWVNGLGLAFLLLRG